MRVAVCPLIYSRFEHVHIYIYIYIYYVKISRYMRACNCIVQQCQCFFSARKINCSPMPFEGSTMVDRRKSQNFTALPDYFTDSLWNLFETSSKEKSQTALFRHGWQLGLRCPSEHTYAVMYNILTMVRPETSMKSMSTFEKYSKFGELKKAWKKFKQVMKVHDFQYVEYLEQLPQFPGDLPQEYSDAAFQLEPAVASRLLVCTCHSVLFENKIYTTEVTRAKQESSGVTACMHTYSQSGVTALDRSSLSCNFSCSVRYRYTYIHTYIYK